MRLCYFSHAHTPPLRALAYDLLEAYRAEVDFAAMRTWQPSKVIKELLEIDTGADRGVSLAIHDADGKEILSGEERRLKADWIAKAHGALGNFAHEPTIRQFEEGCLPAEAMMRAKVEEIAEEIDQVLASPLHNINIGRFVELKCICGFWMRRREESLKQGADIRCGDCGRYWRWVRGGGDEAYEFRPSGRSFPCEKCKVAVGVTRYDVERGGRARCACGAEYGFVPGFSPRLIEPTVGRDGLAGGDEAPK